MNTKVLVTGGSGFVAGWCIVELLNRGYSVRTTLRSPAKQAELRAAVSAFAATDLLSIAAADLTQDAGWDDAVAGCDYVLHVASPLGNDAAADSDSMVAAAHDGTLRVLRAAVNASVKRIVMTSAATVATPPLRSGMRSMSDESVWFDAAEADVDSYRQSKRLAERAAWDFMAKSAGSTTFTTILPGAVFGPVLTAGRDGSAQVIDRLLKGRVPANPRLGFEVVDVRDLALAHVLAMTAQQAAGERFLAVGEFMWMRDISKTLRDQLGAAASKVPTRTLPDFVFHLMALIDPALRTMKPRLGREHRHTSAKAERLLGWHARPAAVTLVDCANSLTAAHSTTR
jgi:nucleoside-diphosphate-sugar epimerase